MDPVIEEMRRAREIRSGILRKWTDYFTARLAADGDTIETLKLQNATLAAENAALKVQVLESPKKGRAA